MSTTPPYHPKQFHLSGLHGISDQTLELHLKLYQGYVQEANRLTDRIGVCLTSGQVDADEMPLFSELTRRLAYEYNGMVLHEYYFGNLTRHGTGDPDHSSAFKKAAADSYGSYATWRTDFTSVAKMRGVGWAICYHSPINGRLSNHWVSLHQMGTMAGMTPVLVLDVWEHAFLLDYQLAERPKYIEAFFSSIDWYAVEKRLRNSTSRYAEDLRKELYVYEAE